MAFDAVDFLLSELEEQCRFALIAEAEIASSRADDSWDRQSGTRLWYAVQNLLVAAAIAHSLLWSKRLAADAAELRRRLGVSDSSPLKNTSVRNHFVHFDDKIAKTVRALQKQKADPEYRGGIVTCRVDFGGYPESYGKRQPMNHLHGFYDDPWRITFHDKEVDATALLDEIHRILSMVEAVR